jgi:sugar transferase (PEP-CTERM/EpsH1 system associated)
MPSNSSIAAGEPLNVVHLVTTLNTGGLERVVLDLVRHADRSRVNVHVVCLVESGDLHEEFVATGVVPHALGLRGGTLASRALRLARHLRTMDAHVLHTHNSGPHVVGALAAVLARVPVLVHTKHGRNYVDRPRAVLANRIASHLSSKIVAVSHDAAEVARHVEKAPERLVTVVHNGVDLEAFGAHRPVRTGKSSFRAIHVARLNKVKDQFTLLRAARIVADQEPEFSLSIVGDGPARDDLERLHRELDLGGRVNFLGMRTDVAALLAEADFFVLSSVSEGISLTLLEAMAAELALVATDVGGNREVVDHEQTGLLVPASNSEALAAAMLQVVRNPLTCRQWGAAGREKVERQFNIRRVVEEYQRLYLELLTEKTSRRLRSAAAPDSASVTAHARF